MKNVNEIAQVFTELYKSKSLYLHQVKLLLDAYYQLENKGSLSQRISIISTFACFVSNALRNELSMTERLKHEVFYSFLDTSSKKEKRDTIRSRKTYKKPQKRHDMEMTLDQILEDAVARGLNQMHPTNELLPSKADEPENPTKVQTTVAVLQPEIIAELSQHLNSQKEPQPAQWEPNKLENYQKWLALTQNGITVFRSQKVPRTKKRNPPTKKQLMKDDKIDITQGDDPILLLQKLQTKLKMSRQMPHQKKMKSFTTFLDQLQSNWMKTDQFRQKLTAIIAIQRIRNLKSYEKNSQHQNMYVFENSNARYSLNGSKQKSSNDSKTKIDDLGQKITKILIQSLLKEKKVKFSGLCKSQALNKQSKGEIFHCLLHLGFELQQKDVADFGEINIQMKAQ